MIEQGERALVYLCRYGRVNAEYWEEQPITRLAQWVRLVGDLIRDEAPEAPDPSASDDAQERKLLGSALENDYT